LIAARIRRDFPRAAINSASSAPRTLKEGGACLAPFLLRRGLRLLGGKQSASELLDKKRISTTGYDQFAQLLHLA
jgi:hypothetical protein